MEKLKKILIKHKNLFLITGITLFFIIGIILHLVPYFAFLSILLTPFFLFGMGCIVLSTLLFPLNRNFVLWIVSAYIFTLGVEIAGVKTGLIFGTYLYGKTLGFKAFGVPLVIGFNWVLIILGINSFIKKRAGQKFNIGKILVCASIAAFACVVFDIVLEPVAVHLDYWMWDNEVIPLHNYIGWFITGFIVSVPYYSIKLKITSPVPFAYVIIQFVFFIILQIAL